MTTLLLTVLAAAFGGLFVLGLLLPPKDVEGALLAEYLALSRGSRAQALAEVEERLASLAQRYPGKSRVWRLRWLVRDLERAKR